MRVFQPSSRLAPYVRELRVVESLEGMERVLVPELGLLAGFRYRGAAHERIDGVLKRVPDASLTGLRRSARQMITAPRSGMIVVSFHSLGAARFFDEPLHELEDLSIPLDGFNDVMNQLAAATTHEARGLIIQSALEVRLTDRQPDALVREAVRRLRTSTHIGALAAELGLSRDRFEKRFRREVGTSPHRFASLMRVRRAIEQAPKTPSLGQLAVDVGYFDQSHFIREFRSVMGSPPSRFFRDVRFC